MQGVESYPTCEVSDFDTEEEVRLLKHDFRKLREAIVHIAKVLPGYIKDAELVEPNPAPGVENGPGLYDGTKKVGKIEPVDIVSQSKATPGTQSDFLPCHHHGSICTSETHHNSVLPPPREDREKENALLQKQVANQAAKITSLERFLLGAGRKESPPMDDEVLQYFVTLRSDIFQFVKSHLSGCLDHAILRNFSRDGTSVIKELWVRSFIADRLHYRFFSATSALFGFNDHMRTDNTLFQFEQQLRQSQCDDARVREWRTMTIKASKSLNYNCARLIKEASDEILSELQRLNFLRNMARGDRAIVDLEKLCRRTYDLGLLFRSLEMEYQWEQEAPLYVPDEHDTIGIEGPDLESRDDMEISFVVFGCVVRGEKGSGLLANGRKVLCRSQTVMKRRTFSR